MLICFCRFGCKYIITMVLLQGRIQPVALGGWGDFSNICKSQNGFAAVGGINYTSSHCCDKMAFYRECSLPNCKKSWWIKLLSHVLGGGDCPNHTPWVRSWFVATFNVIMLFCPLLDDWILCRLCVVMQETWSHSTWFDKCSIHYSYSVSTLWCSGLTLLWLLMCLSVYHPLR